MYDCRLAPIDQQSACPSWILCTTNTVDLSITDTVPWCDQCGEAAKRKPAKRKVVNNVKDKKKPTEFELSECDHVTCNTGLKTIESTSSNYDKTFSYFVLQSS